MPSATDAMQLASHGWRVHPLRAKDKRPLLGEWQKYATTDEDTIAAWWDAHPDANVGVVMGEASGIIDIECDSPAAEDLLQQLFDGHVVPTCCFKSPRGMHRLFKYTPAMPNIDKGHWHLGEIDFKIGGGGLGTYCLFPPSVHPSGAKYEWTISPDECEPAEIPEQVLARIATYVAEGGLHAPAGGNGRPPAHWQHVMSGVGEGERNDAAASVAGKLLQLCPNALDAVEVAKTYAALTAWNATNRPPLPDKELKRTFESILSKHTRSAQNTVRQVVASAAKAEQKESKARGLAASIEALEPERWRVVKVLGDPIYFKLFAPIWPDDMHVRLEHDDIGNVNVIRRKIVTTVGKYAGDAWLHNSMEFKKRWEGTGDTPGLCALIWPKQENEEALPEEKRYLLVLELLVKQLNNAKIADVPDANGRPTLINGSIWFGAAYVCASIKLANQSHTVQPNELVNMLRRTRTKFDQKRTRVNGDQGRYTLISEQALNELSQMVMAGATEHHIEQEAA